MIFVLMSFLPTNRAPCSPPFSFDDVSARIPILGFWIGDFGLEDESKSNGQNSDRCADHRVPFTAAGSARSACIIARAGFALHSLGPTASATARPSRPMRKVVGKPMTP